MKSISAQKSTAGEQQVANEAYWRTKKHGQGKNWSPMKPIDAQISMAGEKLVTNEVHWRPKKHGKGKTGHQ